MRLPHRAGAKRYEGCGDGCLSGLPKDAARVAVAVAETIAPVAVALNILRLEITICSCS